MATLLHANRPATLRFTAQTAIGRPCLLCLRRQRPPTTADRQGERPAPPPVRAKNYKSLRPASTGRPAEKIEERAQPRRSVRLKRTNLRVRGLSLNRSQQWTALLRTTPRLRTRSSTNDLAPLHRM